MMARGMTTVALGGRRILTVAVALLLAVGGLLSGSGGGVARAAACTVLNLNDSGTGSLRAALGNTDGFSDCTAITFQTGLTGTIELASDLPIVAGAVSVTGPGAASLIIDRNAPEDGTAFPVDTAGDLTLAGLTVTGANWGISLGGGKVTLTNSTLRDNFNGLNFVSGTATLTNSTVSGNTNGLYFAVGGAATLTNSTLSGNGSGLVLVDGSTVTVADSTLNGNTLAGLFFFAGGTATVINSTLSGNSSGGLLFLSGGAATVTNTLLAKGGGTNCTYNTTLGPIDSTAVTNGGHNLADDATCFANTAASSIVVPAGQSGLDPAGLQTTAAQPGRSP